MSTDRTPTPPPVTFVYWCPTCGASRFEPFDRMHFKANTSGHVYCDTRPRDLLYNLATRQDYTLRA